MVGVAVRALAILRYVAEHTEPQRVSTTAREPKLHSSTCFNIPTRLVADDDVERQERTKTYALGAAPPDLKRRVLDDSELFSLRARRYAGGRGRLLDDDHDLAPHSRRSLGADRVDREPRARAHPQHRCQRLPLDARAIGGCIAAQESVALPEIIDRFRAVRWYDPTGAKVHLTTSSARRVAAGHWTRTGSRSSSPRSRRRSWTVVDTCVLA